MSGRWDPTPDQYDVPLADSDDAEHTHFDDRDSDVPCPACEKAQAEA